jgi:tetratricopeptide (TPR) repeat protein
MNIRGLLAAATPTATQTATPTNTPTVTSTPSPTATALPFTRADDDETLMVIATFHETTATKTEPHIKIKRAIEAVMKEVRLETLRVEVEPTVLRADERDEAEALGQHYNASIIIWGEDTGIQVLVKFLNLKQPDFEAAEVEIDERERTLIVNPDDYASFILTDLPGQLTFLSFFAVGQSFYVAEQYAQAKNILEQGIQALSDATRPEGVAEAYFRLGWIYSVPFRDLEQAIGYYDRAIELNREYIAAYNNRGAARSDLGELETAIADFNRAIELDPKTAQAYYNRGNAHREQGDLEAAIADYDKAITLAVCRRETFFHQRKQC